MTRPDRTTIAKTLRCLAGTVLAVMLGGCESTPRTDDTALVLRALVTLLTSDGTAVCLDRGTSGKPLALFATMATDAPQRSLPWFAPQPLRPPRPLSGGEILDEQLRARAAVIAPLRQSGAPLPRALQAQLDVAARRLALAGDGGSATIAGTPRARAQWWVRNRLDRGCAPTYAVSNPVVARNVAFVTVTAGHWGTIYAFHKQASGQASGQAAAWTPIGQWSNWVY